MTNLDNILKSRDITLPTKVCLSQSYGFSSSHVWMWKLDYKESGVLKNWCFWTVVLEKTLENPLDCKEIQPIHPKGDQSWVFIGRTDAKAETPILWPPDAKSWLIGKDSDAGRDWGQEENQMTQTQPKFPNYCLEQSFQMTWTLILDVLWKFYRNKLLSQVTEIKRFTWYSSYHYLNTSSLS